MLSEFITAFMEYAEKTYSPKTMPMFRKALQHLSALTGNIRISAITPFHVDLYKTKRIDEVSRNFGKYRTSSIAISVDRHAERGDYLASATRSPIRLATLTKPRRTATAIRFSRHSTTSRTSFPGCLFWNRSRARSSAPWILRSTHSIFPTPATKAASPAILKC